MNLKRFLSLFALWLAASGVPVFAGTYDLKEYTPEIQQALAGRQGRYGELQSLKASGAVGETGRGYTEVLKPVPGAQEIADQENRDRRTIYRAIVDQNHLGPQGMSEVERVFAEVQRDKAGAGDWIETPSGSWIQK